MIDPETGKVIGSLLPVARQILGSVPSDMVGLLGGDWLRHARIRNLARLEQRTLEILRERGILESLGDTSPALVLPILEVAQDENRDELLELWARLLAAVADPQKCKSVRKSFIAAVKEFDPLDALVFTKLVAGLSGSPNMRDFTAQVLSVSPDSVEVSFESLYRLRCVRNNLHGIDHPGTSPVLTEFGRELARALSLS